MPTDKGGKSAQPKSIINRYRSGWGVPPGLETDTEFTPKQQKGAEKTFIHVQSYIENLASRGRHRPK